MNTEQTSKKKKIFMYMCNYFLLFSESLKTANKTWVKDLKLRRQ